MFYKAPEIKQETFIESDEDPLQCTKDQEYSSFEENTENDGLNTKFLTEELILKNEIVENKCHLGDERLMKEEQSKRTIQNIKKVVTQYPIVDKRIYCDICYTNYPNNVEFALHSIIHSNGDDCYSCHFCNKKLKSKRRLICHIKAHDGTSKYKCKICDKGFETLNAAKEHQNVHNDETPYGCDICGKRYPLLNRLRTHRYQMHYEIVTGKPLVNFDCTICKKHYGTARALRKHALAKHNDDGEVLSEICDICGKKLASKEGLKYHKRIHTGQRPYNCQVCSKTFISSSKLEQHKRIHTGEKPYKCIYCEKSFSQKPTKIAHERTHTGERPYSCELCNKSFRTKAILNVHSKTCSKTTSV